MNLWFMENVNFGFYLFSHFKAFRCFRKSEFENCLAMDSKLEVYEMKLIGVLEHEWMNF